MYNRLLSECYAQRQLSLDGRPLCIPRDHFNKQLLAETIGRKKGMVIIKFMTPNRQTFRKANRNRSQILRQSPDWCANQQATAASANKSKELGNTSKQTEKTNIWKTGRQIN